MNGLTAADYADTGQWRLILKVYATGITAHIENTIHTDLEPQLLFSAEWDADADNLLKNIENAVYDHPRVLEDFSARIIVFDPHTLFMPTEIAEEEEGSEEFIYTSVYENDPGDVIVDVDRDLTAVHCLAKGLKGFLSRTFPGAKVESNLMNKVRTLRINNEGKSLAIDVRAKEADFVLLDGGNLLSASTHPYVTDTDIAYHAFNILDVYGVEMRSTPVTITGDAATDKLRSIMKTLSAQAGITEG